MEPLLKIYKGLLFELAESYSEFDDEKAYGVLDGFRQKTESIMIEKNGLDEKKSFYTTQEEVGRKIFMRSFADDDTLFQVNIT